MTPLLSYEQLSRQEKTPDPFSTLRDVYRVGLVGNRKVVWEGGHREVSSLSRLDRSLFPPCVCCRISSKASHGVQFAIVNTFVPVAQRLLYNPYVAN